MSVLVGEEAPPPDVPSGRPSRAVDTRVLAGHLQVHEAIQVALGRPALQSDDVVALTAAVEARRDAVRARSAVRLTDPIKSSNRSPLDVIAARPDVMGTFNGVKWTPEWVDMNQVVSVQSEIITTGLDDRVRAAVEDEAALMDLCFPPANQAAEVSCAPDLDGKGVTLVSRSPNMRVNAVIPDPAEPKVAVYWGIMPGFINVARYQGRHYLRDGHHRVAGLMRAGRTVIPAVVFDAPSFQFVAAGLGVFSEAIATLPVPPLVRYFWDDAVALKASHPVMRTGLSIRATEIRIPELRD